MSKNKNPDVLVDEETSGNPISVSMPIWLLEIDISDLALKVFFYLKVYHGRGSNSKIFPGQALIADRLKVSTRTVKRAVKELEDAGAISVWRRGKGLTNIYTLRWFKPERNST